MKKLALLTLLNISFTAFVFPQGAAINSTGNAADPSAMLDVSGNNKGVLINRMTQAERNAIANPATGLQIFNTTTNCFNFYTGTSWKQICGDCDFNSPVVGNNSPICESSTLNLTSTNIAGATYQWTGPNGFSSTDQNPSIANATTSASGTYSLAVTLNGCTAQTQNTVVTINPKPTTPVASNDGPLCEGETLNLTASNITGAIYNWTGPNSFNSSLQNPSITGILSSGSGTYNVTASVNGCISSPGSTVAIIDAIPATPGAITGSGSVCENSTGNVFSISAVSGATSYNWTVPTGASITSNTGTSITVTFGNTSGDISVTASNVCGTSSSSVKAITVNLNPLATFTTSLPRTNKPVTFYPDVTGATYSWAFNGGNLSSSTTENPVVTWGSTGTYSVNLTVTQNGCSSSNAGNITVSDPITLTYNYTGSIETLNVPTGVTSIKIEAWGAQGGNGGSIKLGGKGAYMSGDFTVTPGSNLKILAGQQPSKPGSSTAAGGGGGSFVWIDGVNTLLIAAGGGGGGCEYSGTTNGVDASITNNGTSGTGNSGSNIAAGGSAGAGGNSSWEGGGGAGWLSNGANKGGGCGSTTYGGTRPLEGGQGGAGNSSNNGGFGGGGGAGGCYYVGGGGGGYSGGAGGGGSEGSGGGGGSYNIGANQVNTAGSRTGNGQINITY